MRNDASCGIFSHSRTDIRHIAFSKAFYFVSALHLAPVLFQRVAILGTHGRGTVGIVVVHTYMLEPSAVGFTCARGGVFNAVLHQIVVRVIRPTYDGARIAEVQVVGCSYTSIEQTANNGVSCRLGMSDDSSHHNHVLLRP